MRTIASMALILALFSVCEKAEVGRAANGERMPFEAPRTMAASPGMYAIMVRGDLYQIEPGGERKGWRGQR